MESSGPAWNNRAEYASLDAPSLHEDLKKIENLLATIHEKTRKIAPLIAKADDLESMDFREASPYLLSSEQSYQEAAALLANLITFLSCELSLDNKNEKARRLLGEIEQLEANLKEAIKPHDQLLTLSSQAFLKECLEHPIFQRRASLITRRRWMKPYTLSLPEETLLLQLAVDGFFPWKRLYDRIAASLICRVETAQGSTCMDLVQASGLLESQHPRERKSAYLGIRQAWTSHEESCAACMNALAGWRLDEWRRRSVNSPLHFLDIPVIEAQISQATLQTMMTCVDDFRMKARRSVRLRARVFGKPALDPWDLQAPAPVRTSLDFSEGIAWLRNAYSSIHSEMAFFVDTMLECGWIEGRIKENKQQGAYCVGFPKSKTPRVYMTYHNNFASLGVLAHEMGHAFHFWSMRELPYFETFYPHTLAETAGIFSEQLVIETLANPANDKADSLSALWGDMMNVEAFLLDIPARFRFEFSLYSERQRKVFSPDALKELMKETLTHFYGESVSSVNDLFWATKAHFYSTSSSFYNFPYTFGYLFSIGILAQRSRFGDNFYKIYKALLRDTGKMSAEELAHKHLGIDLTHTNFWLDTLAIVEQKMSRFENAVAMFGT